MRSSIRLIAANAKAITVFNYCPLALPRINKKINVFMSYKPSHYFCTKQQNKQKDLFQTSQSMMEILLQKRQLETALDLLQQMAFALNTFYIQQEPTKSSKIIIFILQTTITISQIEPSAYLNKFEQIYSLIISKIDLLDQVDLISDIYSIYLAIIDKIAGKNSNKYAQNLSKLGEIFLFAEENTKAEKCILEVLQLYQSNSSILNPQQIIQIYINLGLAANNLKKSLQSIESYQKAIKICENNPHLGSYESPIYQLIGDHYLQQKQYESSKQSYQLSLQTSDIQNEVHENHLNLLFKILKIAYKQQKHGQANQICDKILQELQKNSTLRNNIQYEDQVLFMKAKCMQKIGDWDQAINLFSKYKQKLEKSLPQKQPQYISTLIELFQLRNRKGDIQKALGHLRQLKRYYRLDGNHQKLQQCEQKIKKIQKQAR